MGPFFVLIESAPVDMSEIEKMNAWELLKEWVDADATAKASANVIER